MFNWHNGPQYDFCGYTYTFDIMDYDDVQKIWHEVRDPSGNPVLGLDWSPYHYPTRDQFEDAVVEHMLIAYFKSTGKSNVSI